MLELFGYTREEFARLRAQETYVDPSQRRRYQQEIEEKGAVSDYEVRLRKKDGTEMDCLVTSTIRRAKDGSVLGYQGIIRDITERKRAEEEIRQRGEQLATLNAIAMTVTSTLDLQEVLHAIQERVMEVLGEIYPPLFFLFNEEDQTFKATPTRLQEQGLRRVETLIGTNLEELTLPLPALKPALREALLAGKPYLTDDLSDLSELGISRGLKDAQRELEIKSIVALPLWVKGKLAGIVLLVSPKETMPEEEIELLSAIANQAAIAIENARLYGERRRKADELAALYDISLDVVAQLDLEKLLQTIIERATRLLNARGGGIYLYDPAKREIELRAAYGYFTKDYTGTRLGLGEGLSGKVAQSGEPLVVEDYANWGGRSPKYDGEPSIAVLGVPLKRGDELLGVLFINHEVEKGFHEAEIRLATLFANQTAIAIENASLYEQTDEKLQHRVTELTALNAIAESLTSTLELDEILESIVTRVRQVMEARICTIRLVEGDELTIGAAVGYKDGSTRHDRIKIDERMARIVRDQQPLMVEDLRESNDIPPSRRERARRERVHSFLGVPMVSKEETIGVLSIYGEKAHHFAQQEMRLLSTIANQAALAIERARLHEKVREYAEELEQLVQERTEELMAIQVDLLQSAKLAALGQLAAGVAHELNNPLGAISAYLELLQEEMELGSRETEYVKRIEKRIQQATKIVSELRSVGITSEPTRQTVDINDILRETLSLVERRLSLQQTELQKDMTPNLPQIHADPDRLEQVFINIITNASQAMGEGGTLRVASRESRNGEWVEIIFADTGEGIAKEHLGKIFDPFFTTRSPGEGMGLGLSLSLRHIKDHGGAIHVWSEKGRGTVFRIALPPSGAKRCWEILDCDKKERCKAVRENADCRCWTVMEDVSECERCEVYKRKALPRLGGTLLPE